MFKSLVWNLNRNEKAISDGLVSCALITGEFYDKGSGVIPI